MTWAPTKFPWAKTYPIIGLGYRKGSGKDTAADFLVQKYGFKKFAFAGALKQVAQDLCGFTPAQTDGDFKEVIDPVWGFTPRWFMQQLGTEVGRAIDSNLWIRVLERRIAHDLTHTCTPHSGVVISDMRFPNEMAAIKAWGGYTVEVNRRSVYPVDAVVSPLEHASENALRRAAFDLVITNNETVQDLGYAVDWVMNQVGRMQQFARDVDEAARD